MRLVVGSRSLRSSLDWAMAYRVNAGLGDIAVYGPTLGSPLDPSTPPQKANMAKYGSGEWHRVLIDATRSWSSSLGVGWPPLSGDQQDRGGIGSPNRSPMAGVRDRHPIPRRRAAGAADDGTAEQAASGRVASGHNMGSGRALTPHAPPWFHTRLCR